LDEWIANQNVSLTRPQAIRRLIEIALGAKPKRQSARNRSILRVTTKP
jgi:hypothetical protein